MIKGRRICFHENFRGGAGRLVQVQEMFPLPLVLVCPSLIAVVTERFITSYTIQVGEDPFLQYNLFPLFPYA